MSGLFPESIFRNAVPEPPSSSLNLPFRNSFGPPVPVGNNLGLPFGVSGGKPFTGPTTFTNRSITQHFVTSYDVNNRHSQISASERPASLHIGDLVFVRTRNVQLNKPNPECFLKFPSVPGTTTVEMFNISQLNEWLKERCLSAQKYQQLDGYYTSASELMKEFCFLGSIKNTVDANGKYSSSYGTKESCRMLNLVVSKKSSTRNIFPYVVFGGQELWLIIKMVPITSLKRSFDGTPRSSQKVWKVIPWTSSDSSRPTLNHLMYKDNADKKRYGTCIYVGKAADSSMDHGGNDPNDLTRFETLTDFTIKTAANPSVHFDKNIQLFIKA